MKTSACVYRRNNRDDRDPNDRGVHGHDGRGVRVRIRNHDLPYHCRGRRNSRCLLHGDDRGKSLPMSLRVMRRFQH